ncbi:hypothetical protein FBU30_001068, partial [Linnemannia zychae]
GGLVGLTATGSNSKFDISRLLGTQHNSGDNVRNHRHSLHHPDVSDITLIHDDEDESCNQDDQDEEDDDDTEIRHDSGHYTDSSSEIRGIPIGKPNFRFFNNNNGINNSNKSFSGNTNFKSSDLLFGSAGGSVDSRSRAMEDLSSRYQHQPRYSHSHSNSDSHNSVNLMADNLKDAKAAQVTDLAKYSGLMDDNEDDEKSLEQQYNYHHLSAISTLPDTRSNKSDPVPQYPSHVQYQEQQQRLQRSAQAQVSHTNSTSASSFSALTSPPESTTAPLSIAIAIPQRTNTKDEPWANKLDPLLLTQNAPILLSNRLENNDALPSSSIESNYPARYHNHAPRNISIDTSKARLHNSSTAPAITIPRPMTKDVLKSDISGTTTTTAAPTTAATAMKRAISTNQLSKSTSSSTTTTPLQPRPEGQLSLGLKKGPPSSTSSSSSTAFPSVATTPATSSNSSMRPLLMASQSRLSSALPPAPSITQPTMNSTDTLPASSILLPSLSPSSPRANSALVNSLEQLSVSWKAPENTPSFPINRLHRSRTISSGTRPSFNSSFSSNTTTTSFPFYQNGSSAASPSTAMVTSSSYSSLPYSPAVAFLSNFVEVTAPRMAPDEEGEQVGDFIMGKVIGHGGFSLVREAFAIHLDGLVAQVAVKIVKTQTGMTDNDRVQRMLDKEIAIWSRLTHPNVLPFLAVEKLPTDTFVFCELCTGGNLLDYLTRETTASSSASTPSSGFSSGWGSTNNTNTTTGLDEDHARRIFNQIAEAIRYLHEERRIVHRDIKLENILRHEDGTWKICDFGLAEYQNDEAATYFGSPTIYNPRAVNNVETCQSDDNSSVRSSNHSHSLSQDGCSSGGSMEDDDEEESMVGGSLAYCSPEQLRSQKPLRCPSSDVWSLGVVLYALLTGRLPFQDEYEPRLQHMILNGRYEDPTECSAEARDLLKNMFRSKPDDRWKIGQVMDSPWCTGTVGNYDSFGGNGGNTNGNSNGFGGGFGSGFGGGIGSRW